MSLNSISFKSTDIALLFKNLLVDIDSEVPGKSGLNAGWVFLGENKKRTLIVVRYADEVHLPNAQLGFLTKLLAACNLNLSDVAILNFNACGPSDLDKILGYFQPKVTLLFDIEPGEFGMPMIFPQFQVQSYKDGVFVSTPSLETVEPDKALKTKLWSCLKKIYNL